MGIGAVDQPVPGNHPEQSRDAGIEPTIGEELRYREFMLLVERASEEQLRQLIPGMARQLLVTYPAAIRWLTRLAAGKGDNTVTQGSSELATAVMQDLGLNDPDRFS
jgi:hypothetical protein